MSYKKCSYCGRRTRRNQKKLEDKGREITRNLDEVRGEIEDIVKTIGRITPSTNE